MLNVVPNLIVLCRIASVVNWLWSKVGLSRREKLSKMDSVVRAVIEAIHSSPTRAVLCLSGGASQALGWLLSVPRASSTVLEATFMYSRASMVQLLGKVPTQSVCRETADEIALEAYNRALELSMPGMQVAGIGFTGVLASIPPKRGDHRCFVSARTQNGLWQYDLTLAKGHRDRYGEDYLTSCLLVKTLANVCGTIDDIPLDLKEGIEKLRETKLVYSEEEQLQQLLSGKICMINFSDRVNSPTSGTRRVVLSGSFNPLHDGHVKLLDAACSLREGGLPCYELSAINADKPPLGLTDIKERSNQFRSGNTLVVTNQPYFFKKAELFPDSTFVVGADTALRLLDPKYYGNSKVRMVEVMLGIRKLGCDFLVAGRKVDEAFKVLADVEVPTEVEGMFQEIPLSLFQSDLSSTQLRAQARQQG
ncbi:uncharacterized protein [Physcomitrium patens]|nr:uncharacterized protein LOC112290007 isoform X2 [Physcomitrium patens]|eukprot:XP_024391627.1 uncharacterized protein LOC112290007 isoform X2 [Physcomitrella patens]